MKTILLLSILISPALLWAQEGSYQIKGTIKGVEAPAMAYLAYRKEARNTVDSSTVEQGQFAFKGIVAEAFSATLVLDHSGKGFGNIDRRKPADMLKLYIGPGVLIVNGQDSLSHASLSGSAAALANTYVQYWSDMQPWIDSVQQQIELLNKTPGNLRSKGFGDSINHRIDFFKSAREDWIVKYIHMHPESYVSLIAIKENLLGSNVSPSFLQELYESIATPQRATALGQELGKQISNMQTAVVGKMAPDFSEKDVTGKAIRLSDYKGRYVLIDFWASWCGPCREESPLMVKIAEQYQKKELVILGISLDKPEGREDWLKAIEKDQLNWIQLSDLKGWESAVPKLYGVRAIPENFLIDPAGKIIAKGVHGKDLQTLLASIYK